MGQHDKEELEIIRETLRQAARYVDKACQATSDATIEAILALQKRAQASLDKELSSEYHRVNNLPIPKGQNPRQGGPGSGNAPEGDDKLTRRP